MDHSQTQTQNPHVRPISNSPTTPRPLSADFLSVYPLPPTDLSTLSAEAKQSSMLYSMLPSAVQSRLPRLPSLRRSVSSYAISSGKTRSAPTSPPKSRPGTPDEDAYGNGRGQVVLRGKDGVDGLEVGMFGERSAGFEGRRRTFDGPQEVGSGVGWRYAGQGLTLLSHSMDEAASISANHSSRNDTSAPFIRQLYLHSITYLLRGLPNDLTAEETLSMRSALPPSLAQPITITATSTTEAQSPSQPLTHSHPPSLLHKTLASTIIQLFVLFGVLLPYLKVLLRKMHDYERTHHVTEKLLSGGVGAVDELGKRGFGAGAAVWGAGVGDLCGWVLEEVGGGVREGVAGGLGRVRNRESGGADIGAGMLAGALGW